MKEDLRLFLSRAGKKYRLQQAILFGSRARGDYFVDSDVDLVLISEDFKQLTFRDRIASIVSFWNSPVDLEPLCYTPEEFEKKKNQFGIVQQAVQEGIEISC